MVLVGIKQAQEFIDSISLEDTVAIITDHDPDGFTSGVLFYDYCLKIGAKVKQFTYSRINSRIENFPLENYTKIITSDMDAGHLKEILEKYQEKEILFMDHHPKNADLPDSVLEYRTLDRGYIPSARSAYELTGGKSWMSLVGTLCDVAHLYKENDEFIAGILEEYKMSLDEFNQKVSFKISNMILYLDSNPSQAFSCLQELKSIEEVTSLEKYSRPIEGEKEKIIARFEGEKEDLGGITYFYFEPKHKVKPVVTGAISLDKKNSGKTFIFVSPGEDDKLSISARGQSGGLDMAVLLKAGIEDLKGRAGGHHNASGGTIFAKDLEKFKENIRNFAKKNLS